MFTQMVVCFTKVETILNFCLLDPKQKEKEKRNPES